MAVRPLVNYDNPTLHEKAKRVSRFDGSLQRLIDDMVDTMHAEQGVGLAAPQVGVPLRLCVVELPEGDEEERTALLDLARVAAHRSERIAAPLTTFLLGLAFAGSPRADWARRIQGMATRLDRE